MRPFRARIHDVLCRHDSAVIGLERRTSDRGEYAGPMFLFVAQPPAGFAAIVDTDIEGHADETITVAGVLWARLVSGQTIRLVDVDPMARRKT